MLRLRLRFALRSRRAEGRSSGVDNHNIMMLTNSTLSGNFAALNGGGILNIGGHVNIINSTISGNSADQDGGGIESGRSFDHSSMDIYNTTITNNQADADLNGSGTGGGIFNGANGTFNFQNTILAGNSETIFFSGIWFPVTGECAGTPTSGGNNLMENYGTDHCTVIGTTPPLVDPQLGPLANNGGSTQTHALLPGSPAIDAGNSGGCRDNAGALITIDQRGFYRPVFGDSALRCDIGAFEYYSSAVFLPLIRR